jgi:hypothetical protein
MNAVDRVQMRDTERQMIRRHDARTVKVVFRLNDRHISISWHMNDSIISGPIRHSLCNKRGIRGDFGIVLNGTNFRRPEGKSGKVRPSCLNSGQENSDKLH